MSIRIDVEFWVEAMAVRSIGNFYPAVVANSLSAPIGIVFDKLVDMTRDGKLELVWEYLCPICNKSTDIGSHVDDLVVRCECIEGTNSIFSINTLVPSFVITSFYQKLVSEKNINRKD